VLRTTSPAALCSAGKEKPRLVDEVGARGNIVTDAWYAALAIEHGCTWISFDRDFARFPGLDWRAPA
jgi:predicted nucleic acid-binding protein